MLLNNLFLRSLGLLMAVLALQIPSSAEALITGVSGGLLKNETSGATLGVTGAIIGAPASVIDDAPGATTFIQWGFDEKQNVLLGGALSTDAGAISAGTNVKSHMIFLNTPTRFTDVVSHTGVEWTFDGEILGVMSDVGGLLEAGSNGLLGAPGTTYPGAFANRGMESGGIYADSYLVAGNTLTVNMFVTEPGDWIRVITRAPEPGTYALLGMFLLFAATQKRRQTANSVA